MSERRRRAPRKSAHRTPPASPTISGEAERAAANARRIAARHAALWVAQRDGDAVAVARAAGRLRMLGIWTTRSEVAAGRAARRLVGRAIVRSRVPHAPAPVRVAVDTTSAPKRTWRRAALAVAAIVMAALLLRPGNGGWPWDQSGGREPAASHDSSNNATTAITAPLRGRTVQAIPVVVVASPTPTEAPTAAPTPSDTPVPSTGGSRGGGTSGGGSSGGGGGSSGGGSGGGGSGGGGILPPPSATPTPKPVPTSRTIMPGFARITILVIDARTLAPIPSACVRLRDTICNYTDARGVWSSDIPVSTARVFWDLTVEKDGYQTVLRSVELRPQRESRTEVRLLPKS